MSENSSMNFSEDRMLKSAVFSMLSPFAGCAVMNSVASILICECQGYQAVAVQAAWAANSWQTVSIKANPIFSWQL
jgi:hypothetical protein